MVAVSRQCALEAEDARHEQPWGSETSTEIREAYSSFVCYFINSHPASRHEVHLYRSLISTLFVV
jgi:hypothetical protein